MTQQTQLKMSQRKFYRTKVCVEILTEDTPWTSDYLDVINYEITEGCASGLVAVGDSEELTAAEMVAALDIQGSDPGFFGLDDDGKDTREYAD